jgi:hypothetical protein
MGTPLLPLAELGGAEGVDVRARLGIGTRMSRTGLDSNRGVGSLDQTLVTEEKGDNAGGEGGSFTSPL